MIEFITNNIPSIIAGFLILAVVVLVAVKMVRDKKKGKHSCACGCAGCPSADICGKK